MASLGTIQVKSEVVGTYDLDRIRFGIDHRRCIELRIEILRILATGRFRARVFRFEFYRIQPTFPQAEGEPSVSASDEMILMEDEGTVGDAVNADYPTPQSALAAMLRVINVRFGGGEQL